MSENKKTPPTKKSPKTGNDYLCEVPRNEATYDVPNTDSIPNIHNNESFCAVHHAASSSNRTPPIEMSFCSVRLPDAASSVVLNPLTAEGGKIEAENVTNGQGAVTLRPTKGQTNIRDCGRLERFRSFWRFSTPSIDTEAGRLPMRKPGVLSRVWKFFKRDKN